MTGDIFPRGPPGTSALQQESKAAHLRRLLQPVLGWILPPEQAVQHALQHSEEELLDGCR